MITFDIPDAVTLLAVYSEMPSAVRAAPEMLEFKLGQVFVGGGIFRLGVTPR